MPNRVRFDGASRRFYEVWYTIFVDPRTGDGFWIRYTLLNPLDTRPEAGAALWFAHTDRAAPERSFAVHRVFPRDSFEAPAGGTSLRIGEASLEEGAFRGGFEADGHAMRWELRYEPSPEPHFFFPPWLRRLTERRNSVTIPNPRIFLSGEVTVDGRRFEIRGAPGHEAHHWGIERAPRWIWGHCCAFEEDPEAVLEVLSGAGPGGVMATFVNLYTRQERILCNGLRSLPFNRAAAGLGFWQFEGVAPGRRVVADFRVDPREVQKFVYVSPAYRESECWNTQVGDGLVTVEDDRGRILRTLRARGTVAAEVHDERPERIAYRRWA